MVLDGPPAQPLTGSLDWLGLLDGVILAADSGRTPLAEALDAAGPLRGAGLRLWGCLVNRADLRHYSRAHHALLPPRRAG